jgi:hypothetical protein
MAETPTSPQLVTAYRLIKTGQRQEASRILKSYLTENARDPRAWWLMAHAVDKPDNIRHCLENVLKLDPSHAKAREKLARLTAPDDEPDDSFFGVSTSRVASATAPARAAPPASPTKPNPPRFKTERPVPQAASRPSPAVKFEEFAASTPVGIDPFAGAPVDDPFANIPGNGAHASGETAPLAYDPFASQNAFNPAAHANLGDGTNGQAHAPGTGGQPEWGPGLAFVQDAVGPGLQGAGTALPFPVDADIQRERHAVERMIGFAVIAMAIIVLIGLVLYAADQQGWIQLSGGDKVPAMVPLDGGSFTINYPEGWDMRCLHEVAGYPVCGIANHAFYNEVDQFAGQNVDLGTMVAQSLSMALSGGDLPETQVSIIVMDVPMTSPSYDNGSWAKTKYELAQQGWLFDSEAKIAYDRKEITVSGVTAQYYNYTSKGRWEDVAWDVYVPHDGIILWMRVVFWGKRNATIPDATVQAMINSIVLKPVDQWK